VKLLFDQNLSFRLAFAVDASFPDSKHVRDFALTRKGDDRIWEFAAENGYAIISKDSDFMHRALLHGTPPKVIYLHVGNCRTERIEQLLHDGKALMTDFLKDPVEALLVLE